MRDLDHDLREMFRLHEADVGGVAFAPAGLRRRVRRRQGRTILTASLVLAALLIGALGIRASVGDRRRPVVVPPTPPASTMSLRGLGVGFSADGTRLLTRSMTNPGGFIYDAHTGELIQTVRGPRSARGQKNTGMLNAFGPNSDLFVFARGDPGPITTWVMDATTGRARWRFHDACCVATFSADGHYLAAPCCLVGTRVYDLETGERVNDFPACCVVAFSPDSQRILITVGTDEPGDVVGYVWDVHRHGRGGPTLTLHGPGGANIAMASAAWSPDGSMIALVADGSDPHGGRAVMVFDARTGERMFTIRPMTNALSVAFAPDSSRFAVGGKRGLVTVWEISPSSSSPVLTLHTHETEVPTIAFSPDGRQLMTGGVAENETKIWDLASLSFPR